MKRSSFSRQMKALPTASVLCCLCAGCAVACPSSPAEGFRAVEFSWARSSHGCVLVCAAPVLLCPPLESLRSQPTEVWPFPAPRQEFLQRHVNNSKSCFTLLSALKCNSIGQIFCVNKGKSLWTWQGFYFCFILCIKSFLLEDINLYSEANVFMKHAVNHMHKLGTTS